MEINLKLTDISMVIGQRGTGKSVLTKHLAKKYEYAGHPILVYDTAGDHPEFKSRIVPKWKGKKDDKIQPGLLLNDFEKTAAQVYKRGNMVLVIEELEMVCQSSRIGPEFARLIHLGRHERIGQIMTARRIADVHKLPPSQAHHFFIFNMHLPNDIKYLRAFIGDDVDQLTTLEEYHFLHWHKGKTQILEPVPLEG